jgi:ADP-ribose pyrophosphatase YjhB (NUDIX family)
MALRVRAPLSGAETLILYRVTMTDTTQAAPGWLEEAELHRLRERVPIVYVEAVPVRVDHLGRVTSVGLLLRAMPDGTISRAIVSGRVLYGETVREALWRHLTKDLGPDAEPQLPASPAPFTVAEYFPDPLRTGFHDPRQHAVALAYVVPIDGDCRPSQDALEFTWLSVMEATSPDVAVEMTGGHDRLVTLALAHAQRLP